MRFKVALLQIAPNGSDQSRNLAKGLQCCREASARGADLVVFPELWNIGADLIPDLANQQRWNENAIDRNSEFLRSFASLARDLQTNIAITYLMSSYSKPLNTVSILNRSGDLVLDYAKVCICDFESHGEDQPGCDLNCGRGQSFPVCTLVGREGDVRVGAMICADREFPEPSSHLMLNGAELIVIPNACTWDEVRSAGLLTRAVENLVAVAMANYPSPKANGNSRAYTCVTSENRNPKEPLISVAGEQEEILFAEFDFGAIREFRKQESWRLDHRRYFDSRR